MPLSSLKFQRSITSYWKVQSVLSKVFRSNEMFVNKKKFQGKVLLNVGCGPFPKDDFINLDYNWNPEIDICWDITGKAYPIEDSSLEGIFTEHCLEHITLEKGLENLKEFHRMLKPGGTVRIIVPSGEIYCDLYNKHKVDPNIKLPYAEGEETAMISVNRIFRIHGHQFIYDFETFALLLRKAGFTKIRQEQFGTGNDKRLLIDRPERAVESLYVEAIK